MAEVALVNRTRFTSSLKNELLDQFDHLAKETRIPKSRLFDEAIEDLLKKYAAKDLGRWGKPGDFACFPRFSLARAGEMC